MFGKKKLLAEIEQLKKSNSILAQECEGLKKLNKNLNNEKEQEIIRRADMKSARVIHATICKVEALYEEAHGRQKSADAKPTDFMKGLKAAIDTFNNVIEGDSDAK